MRKKLPIILSFIIAVIIFLSFQVVSAHAATSSASDPLSQTTATQGSGDWVPDAEVTFVGKAATRASDFLTWTLQTYQWSSLPTGQSNPLQDYWRLIRNIVYAFLMLFILGTAFVMVVTKGENVTVMKFIPRFVFVIVLITLSYYIVSDIYGLVDVIQGFFLRSDLASVKVIGPSDLLNIAFGYDFNGYRLAGMANDESAFISLLLVKLTAITYYVMTGILLLRKIILWFFLILSPVFPLLLFYKPIRNTAKIWVGEFFRWLLYAPLFAIFLHGLVEMWRKGIPLSFAAANQVPGKDQVYPTAVSILLGGPGQNISITNSVNLPNTFALYVVALLMLWVVILLPFLLLKIFLDYLGTLSFKEGSTVRQVFNRGVGFFGGPMGPAPAPGQVQPTGVAKSLPFLGKRGITMNTNLSQTSTRTTTQNITKSAQEATEALKSVNISIPKMQDVARYETALMSRDVAQREQATQVHDTLQKIANPTVVTTATEREKFSQVREKLTELKTQGNPVAGQILSASGLSRGVSTVDVSLRMNQLLQHIANPQKVVMPVQRKHFELLKQKLEERKQKGDKLATEILTSAETITQTTTPEPTQKQISQEMGQKLQQAKKTGDDLATSLLSEAVAPTQAQKANLPIVNKVQQVSLEDYEEVRKMWQENYKTLEPPAGLTGETVSRNEWIKSDVNKMNEVINQLTSMDPETVNQGMDAVANILPFLLIGGFSKAEVIAYLKAKLEAAKSVLGSIAEREEEEDSLVERKTTAATATKTEEAQMELSNAEGEKEEKAHE
jgi:hypothetical protein